MENPTVEDEQPTTDSRPSKPRRGLRALGVGAAAVLAVTTLFNSADKDYVVNHPGPIKDNPALKGLQPTQSGLEPGVITTESGATGTVILPEPKVETQLPDLPPSELPNANNGPGLNTT